MAVPSVTNQTLPSMSSVRQGVPLTLTSLTLCLAYVAYSSPQPHRRGQLLTRRDLRQLAAHIGSPAASNTLRYDPVLALHLIWPLAAEMLIHDAVGLRLMPYTPFRLHGRTEDLYDHLLGDDTWARWDDAAAELGLVGHVPESYRCLARSSLGQLAVTDRPASQPVATWGAVTEQMWKFMLRPDGDPGLLFDLLALGCYEPNTGLCVSPVTLGSPTARDHGYDRIRRLLESATGEPLDTSRQVQLRTWLGRVNAYRLRGPILQTANPEQIAALYTIRRLRPYLVEQIGPRHVLFDRTGLPLLRRRLAVLGYPLQESPGASCGHVESPLPPDAAATWIGLRLLAGLERVMPLPAAIRPHVSLERLATTLPAERLIVLEAQADRLLSDLQSVINGRDAFFPADSTPPEGLLIRLQAAVAAEQTITIDYLPSGAEELKRHIIEPLRLEQRGGLTYLVAYSYRAEATLTFRLDRIRVASE